MTKLQTVNRMLSYLTALLLPLLAGCGRADNPECLEYVNSIGLRNMPEGYAAYAVTSANHIFSIDLQSRSALYVKSLPPHCVNTAAKLDIVLNRDDVPCLFFANEDELIRMSPSIWDGRIDIIELRKNGRKDRKYPPHIFHFHCLSLYCHRKMNRKRRFCRRLSVLWSVFCSCFVYYRFRNV